MKKLNRVRLQINRHNTEYWTTTTNILRQGEIGYDTDRKVFKIGDGVNKWEFLRITFTPFKDLGLTIIDGGSVDLSNPDTIPATIVVMTEESEKYEEGRVILRKGEILALREGSNQYMKIGNGVDSVEKLPFVTPKDDASVTSVYGTCEDFRV